MRGYLPVEHDAAPGAPAAAVAEADFAEQQQAIAELAQRKQELMYELASYQNMRQAEKQPVRGGASGIRDGGMAYTNGPIVLGQHGVHAAPAP